MTLTLKAIVERRATVEMGWEGDTLSLTYLPAKVTAVTPYELKALEERADREASAAQEAGNDPGLAARHAFAEYFTGLVVDWDLLEDVKGPKVPLDTEHVSFIDLQFLVACLRAVIEDANAPKAINSSPA